MEELGLPLLLALVGLGLIGGVLSGLLGIGGGIVQVPLLLYVPPMLGFAPLVMPVVAGITAVQSFAGALSGAMGHHRYRRVSRRLALDLGVSMAVSALLGSVASRWVSANAMLGLFALMALVAAALMFVPRPAEGDDPDPSTIRYPRGRTIALGIGMGAAAGVIGQGGAFLFLPVMLYVLHIPTRIAIGTATVVGILASTAVLIGRAGTGQVPWAMALAVVLGAIIGGQLGSVLSQCTPRRVLRHALSLIVAITAVKMGYQVLTVG